MGATTMTIAAITSAVASTAGAVVEGIQNYSKNEYERAEAKVNENLARQSQKQAWQEESLNSTQRYRAGRHDLATGANMMAGMGNVGTSAEAAYRSGAFNLAEDLSAIKYKYDAQAAKYGTQANMYHQNAKVARYNRNMGVLASSIKTVGTLAKGLYDMGDKFGWNSEAKE